MKLIINENGNKRASAVPLQAMLKDEHRSNTDICSVCSSGSREDQQHMNRTEPKFTAIILHRCALKKQTKQ